MKELTEKQKRKLEANWKQYGDVFYPKHKKGRKCLSGGMFRGK